MVLNKNFLYDYTMILLRIHIELTNSIEFLQDFEMTISICHSIRHRRLIENSALTAA